MHDDKRRQNVRKQVAIECMVDGFTRQTMRMSDIGIGGGFIDSPAQVEPGDRIHVTFTLNGQELRCVARVGHVQRGIGFGFAFLQDEMTEDARSAIERFIGPPAS